MLRRLVFACCLLLLVILVIIVTVLSIHFNSTTASNGSSQARSQADFPTVDPNYIYTQLYYMAPSFQHREAGYDKNLPVTSNGHDEFANYWAQEMMGDLTGFGPLAQYEPFHIDGWQGRPATVPAMNVEVSVSGVGHPEQVV